MPIRFACERCGHPFEVGEGLAGRLARCKHCGHVAPIPSHSVDDPAPVEVSGLTLRPLEGEAADDKDETRGASASRLEIRPVPPEDLHTTRGLDPDDPPEVDRDRDRDGGWFETKRAKARRREGKKDRLYTVLDPLNSEATQARPIRLNPHYETRLARFVSRTLRTARNWLFLTSLACLALAAVGYAIGRRPLMYLGGTGVVAANTGMLAVSLFYLITLPFKDSLAKGLATLTLPPYAVYYWVTHWPRMRTPVVNTLRSFMPIAVVGLGFFLYKEAPVIKERAESFERAMEKEGEALERLADPGGKTPAPATEPEPEARPARPKNGAAVPF